MGFLFSKPGNEFDDPDTRPTADDFRSSLDFIDGGDTCPSLPAVVSNVRAAKHTQRPFRLQAITVHKRQAAAARPLQKSVSLPILPHLVTITARPPKPGPTVTTKDTRFSIAANASRPSVRPVPIHLIRLKPAALNWGRRRPAHLLHSIADRNASAMTRMKRHARRIVRGRQKRHRPSL